MDFLENVAQYILKTEGKEIDNCTLIVPGKRTAVLIKKELENKMNTAQFFPEIVTLQDWISLKSDYSVPHPIRLQIELFETYKKLFPETTENLSQFTKWSTTLLADFNEMEKSMVDTTRVLEHLKDFSDIDEWSTHLGSEEIDLPSKIKQKHQEFWQRSHRLYNEFTKRLKNKKWLFSGLQLREVAENIKEKAREKGKVYFIGFNALSKAEETIFDFYITKKQAKILWDIDTSMLQDKMQETGYFIRQYHSKWKELIPTDFNWNSSYFSESDTEFELIGADGVFQQMEVAANKIDKWSKKGISLTKTAHVFCDEKNLLPFLNRLPESIPAVNITMGYSLQSSITISFVDALFKFYNPNKKAIRLLDLENFLTHPFLNHLPTENFIDKCKEERIWSGDNLFWKQKLDQNNLATISFLFENNIKGSGLIDIGFKLVKIAKENTKLTEIQLEFLHAFYEIWIQIASIYEEYPKHTNDLLVFQQFVKKIASKQSLDFIGDPISGLQLMGMLETRLLDFENIIFSGINEGVMPKGKTSDSFIPFDLKKHYGMNTHIENDAVYAYHFFRLLQRAQKVTFIYNSDTELMGQGEMSRFILQMKKEWPFHPKFSLNNWSESRPVFSSKPIKYPQKIERTESVKEIINNYTTKRAISVSYINSYFRDKVLFYQERILKARDTETDSILGYNELGTIVHNTLEGIYNQHIGQVLTTEIVDSYKKQVPTFFNKELDKIGNSTFFSKADNKIRKRVALQYVYRIIRADKKTISEGKKLRILFNEKEIEIEQQFPSLSKPIKLGGSIDRIDELDGVIRILDYKTGAAPNYRLKGLDKYYNEFFDNPVDFDKHTQMLFYGYLIYKSGIAKGKDIQIGLWFIRHKDLNPFYLDFKKEFEVEIQEFEDFLNQILFEVLESDTAFTDE